MSLVYNFNYSDVSFAGLSAVVTDHLGNVVTGSPLTLDASGNGSLSLAEGYYRATVSNAAAGKSHAVTDGVLDVPESITEGGNGVAADETAFFVATGPTGTSDGGEIALTFVADSRHNGGILPDWVSLSNGNPVLGEDAGTCAYAINANALFDFTNASAISDAPGIVNSGGLVVRFDDAVILNLDATGDKTGDGTLSQSSTPLIGGGLLVGSALEASLPAVSATDDGSAPIDDATVTPNVGLTITRIAQAAVLPS